MTTGSRVFGNVDTPLYTYKYWDGTDGRTDVFGDPKWNAYYRYGFRVTQKREDVYGRRWLWELQPNCCFPSIVAWTDNDELKLLSDLSERIKGHSFNMGVSLATGKQTLDLALHTVTRFTSSVRALKRGRLGDAARALGVSPRLMPKHLRRAAASPTRLTSTDVSSMWLELQYGWLPLLHDVYEAQKAHYELTKKPRRSLVRVTRSRKFTYFQPYNLTWDPSYGWRQFSTRAAATYKGGYTYEMIEDLSTQRSLGLTDPASVVWEVIPFSFVADWFIPIGTYFDAMNTIPHLRGRLMRIGSHTVSGICIGNPNAEPNLQCRGSETSGTMYSQSRTLPTGIIVPKPVFESIPEALTTGRLKNGLALLHQALF